MFNGCKVSASVNHATVRGEGKMGKERRSKTPYAQSLPVPPLTSAR
jgi:hypothetical protein